MIFWKRALWLFQRLSSHLTNTKGKHAVKARRVFCSGDSMLEVWWCEAAHRLAVKLLQHSGSPRGQGSATQRLVQTTCLRLCTCFPSLISWDACHIQSPDNGKRLCKVCSSEQPMPRAGGQHENVLWNLNGLWPSHDLLPAECVCKLGSDFRKLISFFLFLENLC